MGVVKLSVYGAYWRAVGHPLAALIMVSLFLMQGMYGPSHFTHPHIYTHLHTLTSCAFHVHPYILSPRPLHTLTSYTLSHASQHLVTSVTGGSLIG